jgi:hypothetical protein
MWVIAKCRHCQQLGPRVGGSAGVGMGLEGTWGLKTGDGPAGSVSQQVQHSLPIQRRKGLGSLYRGQLHALCRPLALSLGTHGQQKLPCFFLRAG